MISSSFTSNLFYSPHVISNSIDTTFCLSVAEPPFKELPEPSRLNNYGSNSL